MENFLAACWKDFLADSTQGRVRGDAAALEISTSITPRRQEERTAARRCELQLAERLGADIKISVSHTQHWVAAIGATGEVSTLEIGLDLERRDRSVHPRLGSRILREDEPNLSPLEAWVIKEAAFKASRPNSGTWVAAYRITSFDRATGRGAFLAPHRSLDGAFQLLAHDDLLIALACSMRDTSQKSALR